jgi:hypothetical protein
MASLISAINKPTQDFVSHVNWDACHHMRDIVTEALECTG